MWIYLIIFVFWLFIYAFNKHSLSKASFLFLFMGLAIFVGLGDMLGGYDRYIYGELFDSVAEQIQLHGDNYFNSSLYRLYPNEIGYGFFNIALSYLTLNRYIFIFILTLISYVLIYRSIIRYCDNYQLAVIIFLGLMFFFTFTYLRQVLAFSIAWQSIQYVYKRKLLKFIIVVFIAATFHNSVILLFPFYFIPIKKYSPWIIVSIALILLGLGMTNIVGGMYETYSETMDDRRGIYAADETGFRIEYIFEAIVFLILLLPFQKYIPDTKKHITLYNVAIYFCFILLIFIQSVNGGRLAWYAAIGIISTLSFLCQQLWHMPNYRITVITICFFLYIRILFSWDYMLYPYKTFLTDGHRDNDKVFELYEYDYNYDVDKFYK